MIKISILGDYVPIGRAKTLIDKGDFSFISEIKSLISDSDLRIVNLEAPVCNDLPSAKISKTGPNLRVSAEALKPLKYLSVDYVTTANNHMMDYGATGLKETLDICKRNGIKTIGSGRNFEEACEVEYVNIKEKSIALINACEDEWSTTHDDSPGCNPIDEIELSRQIKRAKEKADVVIVILHGGNEHYELPTPKMVNLYRWLTEIGADAVIGHHTHCFSGYEICNGHPIVYSLGNFVFDRDTNFKPWYTGLCANLYCDESGIELKLVPFKQFANQAKIAILEGKELELWKNNCNRIAEIIKKPKKLSEEFSNFAKALGPNYLLSITPFYNRVLDKLKIYKILGNGQSNKQKKMMLNLIRCQAHRNVMVEYLTDTVK